MSSHFLDIRTALENSLLAMGLSVAWENVSKTPTVDNEYVRATLLPADTLAASLGEDGKDLHRGIFQLDVYLKAGKSAVSVTPDLIADKFKRGSIHSENGVDVRIRSVSQNAAFHSEGVNGKGAFYVVPIIVSYFAYTSARISA